MSRMAVFLSLLILVTVAFFVNASRSAAAAWNPNAIEIQPPAGFDSEYPFGKLDAVSCSAPGYCSAVGTYAEPVAQQAMVVSQVAGVWQAAQKVQLPAGAEHPVLPAISCSSPGNCVAVGAALNSPDGGIAVEEVGGVWQTAKPIAGPVGATSSQFADVVCPADRDCVAVGSYETSSGERHAMSVTDAEGNWGPPGHIAVPGSDSESTLTKIECPSTSGCIALGVIAGNKSVSATLNGIGWSNAVELPQQTGASAFQVYSFSCGGAGECAVGGSYPEGSKQIPATIAWNGTAWGAVAPVHLPADVAVTNTHSDLEGISCPGEGECVAVGDYLDNTGAEQAYTVKELAGVWQTAERLSQPWPVEPSFPYAIGLSQVDCVSIESCGALGFAFFHQISGLMDGGSWGSGASAVVLPPNTQSQEAGYFSALSCGGPGSCVAVGEYTDPEGNGRAMVLSTEGNETSGGGGGGGEPGGGGGSQSTGTSTSSSSSSPSSGQPSSGGPKASSPPKGSAGATGSTAMVQGGSALIGLRCTGSAPCSGTAKLEVQGGGSPKPSSRVLARASGGLRVIGSKGFKIAPGKKVTIKVPLTKRGKALVASAGKKGLKATLTGTGLKSRIVVLKAK